MLNTVRWVGKCDVWSPKESYIATHAVPLVEEEVLNVAFNPNYSHLTRLTQTCAVNCTSRLAQRVALSHTGLNPQWSTYHWQPGVIKSPASCQNNGVRFLEDTEHTDLLHKYVPEIAKLGVIEERIDGTAYEIDGAVSGENILFFYALGQQWNAESDRILKYERVDYPVGMLDATKKALLALGVSNSCFCIEFRHSNGWKVIDAHARLGEDKGLPELMWDSDPLKEVESLFSK